MEVKVEVLVAQSYQTFCNVMDCSLPGSSVHGILQARILERLTISFPRGSSQPRNWTQVSLEKEMATHSSIHAWKISWTEEPGGLQTMGSQRVGHNWATKHISTCGILVPWQGTEPVTSALEARFLTTGLPGKSPTVKSFIVLLTYMCKSSSHQFTFE